MEPDYYYAESTATPQPFERTATTVYLRKDITEQPRADEWGAETIYWIYAEAQFTPEDYGAYENTQALINGIAERVDLDYRITVLELGL